MKPTATKSARSSPSAKRSEWVDRNKLLTLGVETESVLSFETRRITVVVASGKIISTEVAVAERDPILARVTAS
jgi:hypothetical protein